VLVEFVDEIVATGQERSRAPCHSSPKARHSHNGKAMAYDPRVGMIGGSYGGQVQFAVASIDPRAPTGSVLPGENPTWS